MAMNCMPIKVSCGMNICFVGVVTVIAPSMVHNNCQLQVEDSMDHDKSTTVGAIFIELPHSATSDEDDHVKQV